MLWMSSLELSIMHEGSFCANYLACGVSLISASSAALFFFMTTMTITAAIMTSSSAAQHTAMTIVSVVESPDKTDPSSSLPVSEMGAPAEQEASLPATSITLTVTAPPPLPSWMRWVQHDPA